MTSIFLSRGGIGGFFFEDDEDDEGYDDNMFDVNSAREQLEALVGGGLASEEQVSSSQPSQQRRSTLSNIRFIKNEEETKKTSLAGGASIASSPSMFDVLEPPPLSVDLPRRPPLTSIERERRLAEIDLLKRLRDGDQEAISDLWSLWFSERGPKAESWLKEADELMGGNVRDQIEAERILRSLIEEYGVYFAEPVNRLATLYFSQGRMEEALALNKIVLAVKPWHVGALSHIVTVYEALGDSMNARAWAKFRLPNFSPTGSNKRRERWVEQAISDATRLYEQGEMANAMIFGEPDLKTNNRNYDDDAWQ